MRYNKNNRPDRRKDEASEQEIGQQFFEKEMIFTPSVNMHMFSTIPNSAGLNRFGIVSDGANPGYNPTQTQMILGLMNPWNDARNIQAESTKPETPNLVVTPRSPTRIGISFDVSSLPSDAEITSASLNLTVSSSRNWKDNPVLSDQETSIGTNIENT